MFDEAMRAFLRTGCALIVATVDDDGEPRASRGWGLEVLSEDPPSVRLLVDADDDATLEQLAGHAPIAITAASVRTLESLQLKGHGRGLEPGPPRTRRRADEYARRSSATSRRPTAPSGASSSGCGPHRVAACTVDVVEAFDQTPGPRPGPAGEPT